MSSQPLPLYREPGVHPFKFCSLVLKEDIVDMKSPVFALCIYLQLHYFDGYGRIDVSFCNYAPATCCNRVC